jgi:hypothetical protein
VDGSNLQIAHLRCVILSAHRFAGDNMAEPIRRVPAELLIRANSAAADGPRGFENATISVVKALSKEVSTDDLLAITYRLQALASLTQGDDLTGFTMRLRGREYNLINEAAFKAAAACSLVPGSTFGKVEFDREEFLRLALSFAEAEGNG